MKRTLALRFDRGETFTLLEGIIFDLKKHHARLNRWESELLKVQQQRSHDFYKSYPSTIRYLSKLQRSFSRSGQTVVPIGSSVNGLKKDNSDLDIRYILFIFSVLVTHQDEDKRAEFDKRFMNVESFRSAQMKRVAGILRSSAVVQVGSVHQLVFCNVPIVKFRTLKGTSVDLQFNNIGSVRSSLFVRTCVEWNIVVPIVIHWMNSFFDVVKLKNSRNGLFSSYHLNMLALHFLQSAALSFLPNVLVRYSHLHPSLPWRSAVQLLTAEIVDVERIHTDHVQDISAAHTIVKMIDYYSQLDLQHTAIGVDGSAYERQMDREDDGFIRIVDPYFKQDVGNLRCNVRNGPSLIGETFSALKSELEMGAFRKLTLAR